MPDRDDPIIQHCSKYAFIFPLAHAQHSTLIFHKFPVCTKKKQFEKFMIRKKLGAFTYSAEIVGKVLFWDFDLARAEPEEASKEQKTFIQLS